MWTTWNHEGVYRVSVGFIIGQTDEHIALTQNLGDLGMESAQCSGVITIPIEAVKKVADLGSATHAATSTISYLLDDHALA